MMSFKKIVKIIVGCSFVLGLIAASSVSSYDNSRDCEGDNCIDGSCTGEQCVAGICSSDKCVAGNARGDRSVAGNANGDGSAKD
jgi:uncharacterized low-complexity protein